MPSVVTRWTSLWLSYCTGLRAWSSMKVLFARFRVELNQSITSYNQANDNLCRCVWIVSGAVFWTSLERFVQLLVPTIESCLLLQSGAATLGDVLFCRGRQYQYLTKFGEQSTSVSFEKRWNKPEQPLIITAYLLHPFYYQWCQIFAI